MTGFRGWDNESTGIDINEELAQIANKAALGEEGPGGGYFFFLWRWVTHRDIHRRKHLASNFFVCYFGRFVPFG